MFVSTKMFYCSTAGRKLENYISVPVVNLFSGGLFFRQEVLADSYVCASRSLPTVGRGLMVFDRCETCDCTTGIPLVAAAVSVLFSGAWTAAGGCLT